MWSTEKNGLNLNRLNLIRLNRDKHHELSTLKTSRFYSMRSASGFLFRTKKCPTTNHPPTRPMISNERSFNYTEDTIQREQSHNISVFLRVLWWRKLPKPREINQAALPPSVSKEEDRSFPMKTKRTWLTGSRRWQYLAIRSVLLRY